MASITHSDIHQLVQTCDMEAMRGGSANSGPLILNTLGISEWSNLHWLTEQEGIDKEMS